MDSSKIDLSGLDCQLRNNLTLNRLDSVGIDELLLSLLPNECFYPEQRYKSLMKHFSTTSMAFMMTGLQDAEFIGLKKSSCGVIFECAFLLLFVERKEIDCYRRKVKYTMFECDKGFWSTTLRHKNRLGSITE